MTTEEQQAFTAMADGFEQIATHMREIGNALRVCFDGPRAEGAAAERARIGGIVEKSLATFEANYVRHVRAIAYPAERSAALATHEAFATYYDGAIAAVRTIASRIREGA
jgi:hypothetical protein